MSSSTFLTPQERLATSRKAIVRHMTRDNNPKETQFGSEFDKNYKSPTTEDSTWAIMKHALLSWWHHHPVSVAFSLAKPLMGKFADEQPFKLLAVSAGLGVAVVVLKPWKLVSLGGIALAALKSSDLSSALLSMLSTSSKNPTDSSSN